MSIVKFCIAEEDCGDNRKESKSQEDLMLRAGFPVGHVGFLAHNNNNN